MKEEISKMLAKISGVLDDDAFLDNLDIFINWQSLSEVYGLDDEIGYYSSNEYFNLYSIDVILKNIFNKDKYLFHEVITYISNKYDLSILEEYLSEFKYVFDEPEIIFHNKVDKNNLKIFISFATANLKEANKIQEFFEIASMDCFLSENKLEPSEEYKSQIYNNIIDSDIFIYLCSEDSQSSDWCNQEMGMAYMKYKFKKSRIFIICVSRHVLPTGFLNGIQAEFVDDVNYLSKISKKIDKEFNTSIFEDVKRYHDESIDSKIKELVAANSFSEANKIMSFIHAKSDKLNETQLERICQVSIKNDQIYCAFRCRNYLKDILSQHKDIIDDDLYFKVFNMIS